jgi:hypothetical protein
LYPKLRNQISKQRIIENRNKPGWALVAHSCNPSHSGGRDQEDCGSKPARENPISKKPFTKKRASGVDTGVGPEFKPRYRKKKRK